MVKKNIPVKDSGKNLSTIGGRLAAERGRLGLSQTELAGVGGVTKQTQIKYESGASYPNADYLAEVGQRGIDVTFVVTGRLAEAALAVEETRALYAMRKLKDSARDAVVNMIDTLASQDAEPPRSKLPDTLPGEIRDEAPPAGRQRKPGNQ